MSHCKSLPGQLLFIPSGSESRRGRVIVVFFMHPTYRKRLDLLRQVLTHSVLSQVPQMYHARAVSAHEPRRASKAISLEASASQSSCRSSQTSVTSAVAAPCRCRPRSHSALSLAVGSRATLQWCAFSRGGPGNLGLVGLTGVVSHESTGVEQAEAVDDGDALPGSGGEVYSWLFRSSFIFWSRRRLLRHIWLIRRVRGFKYRFTSRFRRSRSWWRFPAGT